MAKVKGISFPNSEEELLLLMKEKDNFSGYVIDLIKKDLNIGRNIEGDKILSIVSNMQLELSTIKNLLKYVK